jgi:hypothetical protein
MQHEKKGNHKIVGIHQPDFIPWAGFFYKYLKSDVFVILDDVRMSAGASDWTNRTAVRLFDKKKWLTVPILSNEKRIFKICDLRYFEKEQAVHEILRKVSNYYQFSNHFLENLFFVNGILQKEEIGICKFNLQIIESLIDYLNLPRREIILSSSLNTCGSGTNKLANIVEKVGGTIYLSGIGGLNYLDQDVFREKKIKLSFSKFNQKPYFQKKNSNFLPGLSILDMIFEIGRNETSAYLTSMVTDLNE